ncbi:MAG: response regulator [Bdellovibrionaceae bacterium]|nr:response regulator [Pseudobdellovibrionaceae bacterium]MBX3034152.1 response regulator [Pseudobdellovibrionaceae bacterium]
MRVRYAVVDDAPFVRELIKSVMNSLGHLFVGEAGDGDEAMAMVARVLPDIVFMDLVLPKKNGVAVAKEMKAKWPDVYLIACSTLEPSEVPGFHEPQIFQGWLPKPFSKEQIDLCLKQIERKNKKEAKT